MKNLLTITLALLLFSCQQKKANEEAQNLIKIEKTDNIDDIIKKASNIVPTDRQYEWQKLEFTAFLHFGMNTFTGNEWGSGMESPEIFNPTALDVKQWIKVIKSANMKMAMLTAKHHDGFALWQTNTTEHSVKNSPWKNGKGDVLRELVDAAKAENISVGVYLSPADLHEIEREGGTYGNGSKPKMTKIPSNPELQAKADTIYEYLLDDYDALFMNQLYEVLSQYGKIGEVWFDGANPKPGTGQTYNTKAWYDLIRNLQPSAVIAIKGPDVRWVGNEAGNSRPSEWSILPMQCSPDKCSWNDSRGADLGSRTKLKDAKYLYWYPAETDTPIRQGWFYKNEEQYVRTVDELLDIWYRSVGGNTVLLLNLSPDKRGLIPDKDADRMQKLGEILHSSFANNLLEQAQITASETDGNNNITNILNPDITQRWKPKEGTTQAEINIKFDKPTAFNRLVLQEDIKNYSQRIESFSLEIMKDNKWQEIVKETVVGYKRIVRFPMQKTQQLRLKILESRTAPSLGFLGIYLSPEILSTPQITRNKEGIVNISCKTPEPKIYYTLDGSTPTISSLEFTKDFSFPQKGIVKAIAVTTDKQSEIVTQRFDIAPIKWKIISPSEANGYNASYAIDGNPKTMWHTTKEGNELPHTLTIDLGETLTIKGFTLLPRTDGHMGGIPVKYKLEGSTNGKYWYLLKSGKFGNIKNNPVLQEEEFTPREVKHIRFTALSSVDGAKTASIAEFGVITE